jgi:N-methylhydantoinase B/oxoprolinase/acetone carboxylase alpha subunit
LAGGGGWGDPLDRDPEMVLTDVRNELVSAQAAARDYGVVVDSNAWCVDARATGALRAKLRQARPEVPDIAWHDVVMAAAD